MANNRKRRIIRAGERETFQTQNDAHEENGEPFDNITGGTAPSTFGQDHFGGLHDDQDTQGINDDFDDEEDEQDKQPNIPIIEREDDEGEDLYGETMERDYKEMPHLDVYSSSQLDEQEYAPLDLESRLAVDAQLNRRDAAIVRQQSRIPEMFLPDLDDNVGIRFESKRANRQLEQGQLTSDIAGDLADADLLSPEAITEAEAAGYSLDEFLGLENCRRRVGRDYRTFLTTFLDEHGQSVYKGRIKSMCAANEESLEVSYEDLARQNPFLAKLLAHCPRETLRIFEDATFMVVLEQFPEYHRIKGRVHVRISGLPTQDSIRDLRHGHLGRLVRVQGVVTRRTGVFPQLQVVKYVCGRCGVVLGPFMQDLAREVTPGRCSSCEGKGPFSIQETTTVYRNYQKITLQESPSEVPAGRLPRSKEVVLMHDLIDIAKPGELIEVTGIYMNNYSYGLNTKNGFPVFATLIEANWLHRQQDQFIGTRLTEEDMREIKKIAADPRILEKIVSSIAPSIYGHENIKTALALSLFGGQAKSLQGGKVRLRGDANILLLGDPGTAKSQFLKYIQQIAPRAVYTTGQGASAVGLTAAVRKDPMTREWTLEGGALVLADQGHCLIDEFDKMNDADRTSIHEAMEQQTISISKAGIVTTLHARCAVIAAANPIRGRYNPTIPFSANVALTDPILSRFDVLCVVRDTVDPVMDRRLADFVVNSHRMSHPLNSSKASSTGITPESSRANHIDQEMLKKYLVYARSNVFPTMRSIDQDKLVSIYADLRQHSLATGGIPITVRHVESMVRLSEASARLHLRSQVTSKDIDLAIRVLLESFISSQKYSITKRLSKAFARYITLEKDHYELLLFTLQEEMRAALRYVQSKFNPSTTSRFLEIPKESFEGRVLKDLGIPHATLLSFYESELFSSASYSLHDNVILYPMPTLRDD